MSLKADTLLKHQGIIVLSFTILNNPYFKLKMAKEFNRLSLKLKLKVNK